MLLYIQINQNIQAKQNHINLSKARSSPNKYGIYEDIPSHELFDHAFFQNFEISNALLSLSVDDPIGDNTIVKIKIIQQELKVMKEI